jgi:hypothetical protein
MSSFYNLRYILCIIFLYLLPLFAGKTLNVTHYKQCGQSWSSMQIGTCGANSMCSLGCACCCVAMISHADGTGATPGTMANFFNSNNYWAGDCLMDWTKVPYYPGSSMQWGGAPAFSMTVCKQQIDNNNPYIVHVKLSGNQDHFIVGYGYDNNGESLSDWKILDPLRNSPSRLNEYSIHGMRIYNNVIQNSQITFTFKINNIVLAPVPNSFKLYKYPPIPSIFYNLQVIAENLGSNTYDMFVERPDGALTEAAQNIGNPNHSQPFNVSASNTWFPNSGGYKLKIFKNANPPELWATSEPFYISVPPQIDIDPIPAVLYSGQTMTVTFRITGGIPGIPFGGWENTIQVQLHKGGTSLNTLGFPPVSSTSHTFTVPSSVGDSFRISVSNPPGSSIPTGYIFDYTNYFSISNPIGIIKISEIIPASYSLYSNYPNPFNSSTKLKFDIAKEGLTTFEIFDVLGKKVASLVNDHISPGKYEITFEAGNLPSGIYFYKIISGSFIASKKLVVAK